MKFYPHHIGDFDHATRHLTRIERSIYRDLIDVYYDTEQPLSLDTAYLKRKIMATSEEESQAVEQVLKEFFIKTENGWFNGRCDTEIIAYRKNNSQKSMAGKASAAARASRKQHAVNATQDNDLFGGNSQIDEPEENTENTNDQPKIPRGRVLPADWTLPKKWGGWALNERSDMTEIDVRNAADSFRDHWHANANQANGKKLDWEAAWRNWIRKTRIIPQKQPAFALNAKQRGDMAEKEFLQSEDVINGEFRRV